MGYSHYFCYKNPAIELAKLMNDRLEIHNKRMDEEKTIAAYDKLPTHQSLVDRIVKHTEAFKKIAKELNTVLPIIEKEQGFKLFGGLGEGAKIITPTEISFNGDASEDLDHETFGLDLFDLGRYNCVDEYDTKEGLFNFCKTARKPYDFAVCLSLIVMKHHLGKDFKISSDGGFDEWDEIIKYYETFFKRKAPKDIIKYFEIEESEKAQ